MQNIKTKTRKTTAKVLLLSKKKKFRMSTIDWEWYYMAS